MKTLRERSNTDLLELVLQLHARSFMQTNNRYMHDAYMEARSEMETRLAIDNKVDAYLHKSECGARDTGNHCINCYTAKECQLLIKAKYTGVKVL